LAISRKQFARTILDDQHRLIACILARCGDPHAAEDVAQDVITLALERMEQFEDVGHLLAWCRETARRKTLERLRTDRRQPLALGDDVLDLLDPHYPALDATDNADALDALRRCLATLSRSARRVIEARYRDGLTGARLAEAIGGKFNTVYSTLSRAHAALAVCVRSQLRLMARHDD